jgi:hypothetical protein
MEDDGYVSRDVLVQRIEALCCLAETCETTTNRAVRRRLVQAMDIVIAEIVPAKEGRLIDVTRR